MLEQVYWEAGKKQDEGRRGGGLDRPRPLGPPPRVRFRLLPAAFFSCFSLSRSCERESESEREREREWEWEWEYTRVYPARLLITRSHSMLGREVQSRAQARNVQKNKRNKTVDPRRLPYRTQNKSQEACLVPPAKQREGLLRNWVQTVWTCAAGPETALRFEKRKERKKKRGGGRGRASRLRTRSCSLRSFSFSLSLSRSRRAFSFFS